MGHGVQIPKLVQKSAGKEFQYEPTGWRSVISVLNHNEPGPCGFKILIIKTTSMKTRLAYALITSILLFISAQCKTKESAYKNSDEYKEQLLEDSLRKHI